MDYSDILLTVDYDRTLTGPDSVIPQRNLEAIRHFIALGGTFTVNTGRSVPMSTVYRDVVPTNAPLLLYNGSAAYDVKTKTFRNCRVIPLDQGQTVRMLMERYPDMTVEVQSMEAHYRFSENPAWDAYSDHNLCPRGAAEPDSDLGPFLKFTLYGEVRGLTVGSFFDCKPGEMARMDAVEAELKALFGDSCAVFRAAPRIIDVQAKGVSKLRAARDLQRELGKKVLICVGDGENDVTMLDGADWAFCPGDAIVKDRYENVCGCAEGAVADVIYRKIPEILKK